MTKLPASEHLEARGLGYSVAGTRISLASIACAVRRGETVEEILADFPAIESRAKLEGAVAFIHAHSKEIDTYLSELAERWKNTRTLNPIEVGERARWLRQHRGSTPNVTD